MAEYEHSSPTGPLAAGGAGSARGGDLEAGVSGGGGAGCGLLSPGSPPPARRWGSYAALGGPLSPRPGVGGGSGARFFLDPALEDEPRHFLDACFLCKRPLSRHRDIYMYRGDTPFCSEECRQEQIEIDEARETAWSLSVKASAGASRKEQPQKQKDKAAQGIQVRAAGAVVAV